MSRLAHELTLRSEPVVVVAPQTPGSRDFDTRQRFRVLRYPRAGRVESFIAMALWLFRARLGARNGYIIASMWFPAGLAACLLPRFLRGRLGVLAHGSEIAPSRGGFRRHVMRYVFARADVVIANSRFTRGLLGRAGVARNVVVVSSGIDEEPSVAPCRAQSPVILSVGRLVARKGFDTVIAALPQVLARFPDARYEIVGDGPQRAELVRLARSAGVSEYVSFLGAVNDARVREAYARAWCFALPVRAIGDDVEGFGLVYLEAALAGLPAIGGLHSGAEDTIAPGDTGLLVDGTSSEAVAEAIITLLDDPERSAQMGIRGRERALANFTWRRTAAGVAGVMAGTSQPSTT
jgi:phosphatidylinositol alpha-1,6-mannosyltransferase